MLITKIGLPMEFCMLKQFRFVKYGKVLLITVSSEPQSVNNFCK